MNLYLIRHAEAAPLGEGGVTGDAERPLTEVFETFDESEPDEEDDSPSSVPEHARCNAGRWPPSERDVTEHAAHAVTFAR